MSLPGLFITGTDTGVGKTAVVSAIARLLSQDQSHQRRVGVLKPVATGANPSNSGPLIADDTLALAQAVNPPPPLHCVTPLTFEPPLAPPVAARLSGSPLDWDTFWRQTSDALAWWQSNQAQVMVVEGVGGVLCPLTESATVADLAIALDFPVLLVARRGLGTLNHTLLSVEALARRGLRIAGVLLNQATPPNEDELPAIHTNSIELSRWLPQTPLLAELDYHSDLTTLQRQLQGVNWFSLARLPRHSQT